jgi:hypothetical protein
MPKYKMVSECGCTIREDIVEVSGDAVWRVLPGTCFKCWQAISNTVWEIEYKNWPHLLRGL